MAAETGGASVMNGLPYYKAYPRDFIEGTIGMPFELKGAYRLVLDLIYMQGGTLPDDSRYISGLLGCSTRQWNSYREKLILMDKIQSKDGYLTNYRAVSELETLAKLQRKQSENRSRPNKTNDLEKPRSDHTEPDTDIDKEIEANASTKKIPKGTRLPEDWHVPRPLGEWAVEEGMPADVVRREAAKFRDYWRAQPGQKGVKLDWPATWRNWVRKWIESSQPKRVTQDDFWTGKVVS